MSPTPVLKIDEEISLIPVNKSILSSVIEAYNEDPAVSYTHLTLPTT